MEEQKFEDVILEGMRKQRDEARKMIEYFEHEIETLETRQKRTPELFDDTAAMRLYLAKRNFYDIVTDHIKLSTNINNYIFMAPFVNNNHCV